MSPSSSAPPPPPYAGPTCGVRKKSRPWWCLGAPDASDFLRDTYGDTDLGNAAGSGGAAAAGGGGGEEAPFCSAARASRRSLRHVAQTPPPGWYGCFLHLMPIPLRSSPHLISSPRTRRRRRAVPGHDDLDGWIDEGWSGGRRRSEISNGADAPALGWDRLNLGGFCLSGEIGWLRGSCRCARACVRLGGGGRIFPFRTLLRLRV
uniref:Uncharacterized protein n=1 Tax=Arundo donax TaxID=35708 RepID=A0A0A9DR76_ARUDO